MNRLQESRLRHQLARQRQSVASLPEPPEQALDENLPELRRIASQIEVLHKQSTTGAPALRALLVEVAAQTSVIAELVSDLASQQTRTHAAPITGLEITARDADDRIQSITVTRGEHH